LGAAPTTPLAANKTGVVAPAPRGEGPTQVRAVEPGQKREETRRAAAKAAVDFVRAEEEALDDEPLPVSRRQHVLRYFTALRRQLGEPESRAAPRPDR
jgi:hypothetical protein